MTAPTHNGTDGADGAAGSGSTARLGRRRTTLWRLGTPLVVLVCGGLFVVSAQNSQGTDLRPGRYNNLATVVSSDAQRYQRLEDRVSDLNAEVAALTRQVDDDDVTRYQRQIDRLGERAGLSARSGPGLTITLADASEDLIEHTDKDPNLLVIHQQDVQAVVNALWRGGAQAITIQGQRIISTTGIKCSGSTIQLQGVPYAQPFVIRAVGDLDTMVDSIDADSYVSTIREQADDPDIAINWKLQTSALITAPAYDGLLDLDYAKPVDAK